MDTVLHRGFIWYPEPGGLGLSMFANDRNLQRSGCWAKQEAAHSNFSKDSPLSWTCLFKGAQSLNRLCLWMLTSLLCKHMFCFDFQFSFNSLGLAVSRSHCVDPIYSYLPVTKTQAESWCWTFFLCVLSVESFQSHFEHSVLDVIENWKQNKTTFLETVSVLSDGLSWQGPHGAATWTLKLVCSLWPEMWCSFRIF